MRSFQPFLFLEERLDTRRRHAGCEQCPLDGIGRLPRQEELLDVMDLRTEEITHRVIRQKEQQRVARSRDEQRKKQRREEAERRKHKLSTTTVGSDIAPIPLFIKLIYIIVFIFIYVLLNFHIQLMIF